MAGKRRKRKRGCCGCFPIFGLLLLGVVGLAYYTYTKVLSGNSTTDKEEVELLIPNGASFDQVVDSLNAKNLISNEAVFRQVAKLKKYPDLVKPGRYIVKGAWNNLDLVDHLRSGKQEPIKFVINNARTKADLAGIVAKQFTIDSLEMLHALQSTENATKYGFTKETFPAMFLANTYEMYWNTDIDGLMQRMKKEYKRYWNDDRVAKAKAQGLEPNEVIALASIVEEETKVADELPVVAGLYLNRLKRGIPLQADPTVKFAVGDFTLRRILNKHLEVDSPYNTYKYSGLPPGPIRIPELNAVNAVLNPKSHNYIYMCAKPDFSGRHAFAKTLAEHNRNATRYHEALNREGIQ